MQAAGSKLQITSGLHPNLYAIQRHQVFQAAEAQQEPSCARCRDLRYVRALKACSTACNTAPLATQPAGLTAAKSGMTTQKPAEPAATATASHAANSGAVIPAPAQASVQPASQTESDTDAQALGAKPASTHLTPTADPAARMGSMSDCNATQAALQSAESAGAGSAGGCQVGRCPLHTSNSSRKRKRRLSGACNAVPAILQDQPAGPQPNPLQRTVSSKRREKEKRRLAGTFSSVLCIMQACVCNVYRHHACFLKFCQVCC